MFFFSDALLMQGGWLDTIHVTISALFGIYLLSSGIIGWFFGRIGWMARALLICGALAMLDAGLVSDLVGLSIGTVLLLYQKNVLKPGTLAHGKD
jgi:TRAP-type uncharacterized transport system fused permease subunit